MPARLWSKGYVIALVVGFCLSMVFFMLMTSMALYATREFGAGDVVAGLTASIFVIGAVVARLGAGVAVDRLGRRRVLLVSLAVSAAAAVAYFAAAGLVALLAVRLLHGLAFGTAHTAASTMTQLHIPPSRRAEGTGYYGATTTLGTAVGPLAAVLLADGVGYDGVFVAAAVVSFLALGVALGLRVPGDGPGLASASRRRRLGALVEPSTLPIASFIFLGALAFSGVVTFVNPFATSLGLTSAAATFFLVHAVVVLVLRPIAGRLQDARGDNVVIYPGIVAFALGLGVLVIAGDGATLLVAAVLLGIGWGTVMSAGQAIAVTRAPIANVGRTMSTYFLFADLGMGFGPIVLGWLAGALGFRWMYGATAVLVLVSTLYYRAVHGARRGGG